MTALFIPFRFDMISSDTLAKGRHLWLGRPMNVEVRCSLYGGHSFLWWLGDMNLSRPNPALPKRGETKIGVDSRDPKACLLELLAQSSEKLAN
jgi:hypothetical protein